MDEGSPLLVIKPTVKENDKETLSGKKQDKHFLLS